MKAFNRDPSDRELVKFGFTLIIGLPIAGLFWTLLAKALSGEWRWNVALAFACVGLVLGAASLLSSVLGRWIYNVWHRLVEAINEIASAVSLSIVFYVLITPIGYIKRNLSKRGLRKGSDSEAQSYWIDAPKEPSRERYFRQY